MAATAAHLPTTTAQRGGGFISNGSSEPRSRSPAVVSSAALRAPYSTAMMTKNGSMKVYCEPRVRTLARSRSSTRSGSSTAGATPRSASARTVRSRAKPPSRFSMRRTPDWAR